jgi:hypothetical protein
MALFQSKWTLLSTNLCDRASPMYFYPQSRLVVYKGKVWQNPWGTLTKLRMMEIIGQFRPRFSSDNTAVVLFMADALASGVTIVLHMYLRNNMHIVYSLERLWVEVWGVRRLQGWWRRMERKKWEAKALAFIVGTTQGGGMANNLLQLTEDLARMCLEIASSTTTATSTTRCCSQKKCRTFNVMIDGTRLA